MPSQTSTSKTSKKRFSIELLQQLVVFAAVFALAVTAVRRQTGPEFTVPQLVTDGAAAWYFLTAFAAATILFVILIRTVRGSRVFAVMFALAVFTGSGTLFNALFGAPVAVLLTSLLVFIYYGMPYVGVFDAVLTLGAAGIAVNLGTALRPIAILMILVFLAFYDILAVYATRHMVAMSEALLRRKAFFAMILPETIEGFSTPLAAVEPGQGFIFLGAGDVILPAILVAAAAKQGILAAIPPALGAMAGIVLLHLLFSTQKERRPMPALPPIALGAIVGYGVTVLLS